MYIERTLELESLYFKMTNVSQKVWLHTGQVKMIVKVIDLGGVASMIDGWFHQKPPFCKLRLALDS